MLKVGLTGGIGSGKTTVSNLFSDLAVPVIDTDVIAHELVDNEQVLNEIVDSFGKAVLDHDGKLDRKKLGQLVFSKQQVFNKQHVFNKQPVFEKQQSKQKLENILHPKIRTIVNKKIHQLTISRPTPAYVIIVIPLLIETNFSDIVDRILIVMTDKKNRVKRISQRDDRSIDEIHSIISAQASDQQRIDIADDIIKNDSDISELNTQIKNLHEKFLTIASSIR